MAKPLPPKQDAVDALRIMGRCLGAQRITYMLDGGTLLGAVRDGDFCADDHNDIDLTILEGGERLSLALEQAMVLGFELHHGWPRSERGTMQAAMKRKGVKVDLMVKEVVKLEDSEGDWLYWTVYGRNDLVVPKAIPMALVLPLKKVEFHGVQYNVPGDTDGYLHYRYGNWRQPVHRSAYSCYTSDQAILPAAVRVQR
jgi:phosphorylcholine metabolism protein LicD